MSRLPFDPKKMPSSKDPDAPLSVSRLAALIDGALREKLPQKLRVVGEISGLAARTHWYFRLADDAAPEGAEAVVDCVMFAASARRVGFEPRNGQRVLITGRIEFYARQGRTQFYAEKMEQVGVGDLDLRLKALLAEIKSLGWLDPQRKRPLPTFPRRIAVVTSRTGAALQDVLVTMRRRCPAVGVLVVDVRVQGDGSAAQIARAIDWLSKSHETHGIDAILVTRGGGSMEDLWAFNERIVAEAIVRASVPVVAAIGHETDVTIAELVADERCATPTQAAMRLTPDRDSLTEQLDQTTGRLITAIGRSVARATEHIRALARHRILSDPRSLLTIPSERLEDRRRRLAAAERRHIAAATLRVERLAGRLAASRPEAQLKVRSALLSELTRRLRRSIQSRLLEVDLANLQRSLAAAGHAGMTTRLARLDTLERELLVTSPQRVLNRGYSVTTGPDGRAVRSASEVSPGQVVTTRVAQGAFHSRVTDGGSAQPEFPRQETPALPPRPVSPVEPRQRRSVSAGRRSQRGQMGLFGSGGPPE